MATKTSKASTKTATTVTSKGDKVLKTVKPGAPVSTKNAYIRKPKLDVVVAHDASALRTSELEKLAANLSSKIKTPADAKANADIIEFFLSRFIDEHKAKFNFALHTSLGFYTIPTETEYKRQKVTAFMKIRIGQLKLKKTLLAMSIFVIGKNGEVTEEYVGNTWAPAELNLLAKHIAHETGAFIVYDAINDDSMFENATIDALRSYDDHWFGW